MERFLYSIGLYLFFYKFNSNKTDYLTKWENFMLYVANLKNKGKTEEESIIIIKNELKNNLYISFENNVLFYNKEMINS